MWLFYNQINFGFVDHNVQPKTSSGIFTPSKFPQFGVQWAWVYRLHYKAELWDIRGVTKGGSNSFKHTKIRYKMGTSFCAQLYRFSMKSEQLELLQVAKTTAKRSKWRSLFYAKTAFADVHKCLLLNFS